MFSIRLHIFLEIGTVFRQRFLCPPALCCLQNGNRALRVMLCQQQRNRTCSTVKVSSQIGGSSWKPCKEAMSKARVTEAELAQHNLYSTAHAESNTP